MIPQTAVVLTVLVAVSSAYITDNGYKIVTKHSTHYFDQGANAIDSYQPVSGIGGGYSEAGLVGYKTQAQDTGYPENGYDYRDYYTYPKYKFNYGVQDAHTGDHKSQWEIRDGDVVKGGYTLYDADGTKRIVEYSSDKHNGFQAHVKRVGHAHHPQVYKTEHGISGGGYDEAEGYSYSNIDQHL